jgi:hypothetical protein
MENLSPVIAWLRTIEASGFYGSITLRLQAGKVTQIIEERSHLPHELKPENRRNHEQLSH